MFLTLTVCDFLLGCLCQSSLHALHRQLSHSWQKNKSVSTPHETHSVITSVSDDSAMYNYCQQLISDINEK